MPDKTHTMPSKENTEILIVEDSPTQTEYLEYLLERNHYRVSVATNGREALALLAEEPPHLVLSDIMMPEMSGFELCRAIKKDARLAHIPVILVTSLSDVQDVVKGLECGADNFIRKPYDEKYLLSRIDYLLMNRAMRQDQKLQVGMELYLSGQKHFISSDRQQILDLLISTYEEAVRVKRDLEQRQQELTQAALYEHTHGEVLRLFNSTFDRRRIMNGMLEILAGLHPFPVSCVYGYDEWNGIYSEEASYVGASAPHVELRVGRELIAEAARDSRIRVVQNTDELTRLKPESAQFAFRPACIALCPASYQDKRLAVLVIVSGRQLDDRDQTFIERIAVQLGVALHNVQQYEDLRLLAGQLRLRSEEIIRKNTQLEDANRMKSEFLANMSHELRTPLNAIIGFSEVLRDNLVGPLTEQQREYVTDIFESGRHLLYLINDVLDLSKIEAGKMVLEGEPTDIAALLSGSLSIIREKAAAHRVQLALDAPDSLGTAWLDPRKLKQIVYNLLSNAVKFSAENGRVTLRARVASREEAQSRPESRPEMRTPIPDSAAEFLEIAVDDTGIGIAQEDMPRLFQPFVQLDSSLSRRFDGTGLGLVMVKRLAELHAGAVSVASLPGAGSTFTVWLPYRSGPFAPKEETGATLQAPRQLQPMPAGSAPLVMIVEDDARAADLIRLQLENDGCRTVYAPNAEFALSILDEGCIPDLITLDILLPGMDGWDFLARLKAKPQLAQIPVVIVSIVADGNKGLALGASKVLQKPITAGDLSAALADIGFARSEAGATVLVVDDDPRAVEIIATHLDRAGFAVLRAYSGEEGLLMAKTHRPGLILLDLLMPDMSGFQVAERLKATAETARTPILVLTAKHLSAEDRRALNGRALEVVEKSQFNHGSFIGEVRRALGKKWQRS